ncbi:hypothetical protein COCSUDRAFT_59759 [Coccomyxa subellipsoidea C-169]|uniref:F-box domain-containing protein n=1 Tax=Coccomyxa subellipsoidea (strain C-169) TaxID=574566 RepID=I0YKA9_COCSC|nr:hypothetical protein COCSUDRAFT_59759 [Coccomyxa subellipsoidea C-169]EIE18828.1 hypothetical protein COCSUDRAFT_59759 [Coccomyxa subellipsoidea C-169]|eukprot:XP_005643372.1 hypothetical protein COCSUDRAFT_59759 [Coccomyxa subellipsoidea C-169]
MHLHGPTTARRADPGSTGAGPADTQLKDMRTGNATLPQEVWQKIASHLGVRNWAQVSGTCKATWNVELQDVRVYECDRLGNAGVAWLLKRAQHARTLLIGELFGEALQDFALGLLQSPHSFTNLAALSLNREDNYRHKRTHEEAEALLMMWTWLAGQARQLQYLNLTLIQLKGLPRLPQLKHLQLHLKNGDCRRVARCMTDALPSLQTLHIICLNDSQDDGPELLLAAMTQLRSLALRGVLPASLALPESTQLHVRVHDIHAARHPIWISLLPHLRTFHIDMQKEDSSFDAKENIPLFLFGPSSLETLIVSVRGFETVKAPIQLRGSFLEVERLAIDTLDDIHVEVPAGHGWRLVNFHTCKSLGIRLHDMENFVDNRPEFSFQFTTLQGMGVMLLTRYMAERGPLDGIESHWS